MNIYILPYVYMGIHKITGKIYIGSRANKLQNLPSNIDLQKYKTSSKIVKPIFDEFEWHIIAEFFNPKDAYDFEQQLIHEQWQVSKELSLNKVCYYGKETFNMIDNKHSEETLKKLRKPKSDEHRKNLSIAKKGKPGFKKTEETKRKIKESRTGYKPTQKTRNKMSKAKKGKLQSLQHIRNRSKIIDVLTPDGFVIENTTMRELCSQFNLNYGCLSNKFGGNEPKPYKGFTKL